MTPAENTNAGSGRYVSEHLFLQYHAKQDKDLHEVWKAIDDIRDMMVRMRVHDERGDAKDEVTINAKLSRQQVVRGTFLVILGNLMGGVVGALVAVFGFGG